MNLEDKSVGLPNALRRRLRGEGEGFPFIALKEW